jgi:cell shape-determining protein MreD
MKSKLTKTAAVITCIIGAMAIFAGGQVLLGKVMDYYVIDWLPVYNLTVGLISAFFTAIIIWKGSKMALPAAVVTLASHASVMLILQTAYRDVVAPDSVRAMTVRIVTWLVILALMFIPRWENKHGSLLQS